jgi:hypothetical protein
MVYNLLCDNGFDVENAYDEAINFLKESERWENGAVLSVPLCDIFMNDLYLKSILYRDHENIKNLAKRKINLVLPSLRLLIKDWDFSNVDCILRPVIITFLHIIND